MILEKYWELLREINELYQTEMYSEIINFLESTKNTFPYGKAAIYYTGICAASKLGNTEIAKPPSNVCITPYASASAGSVITHRLTDGSAHVNRDWRTAQPALVMQCHRPGLLGPVNTMRMPSVVPPMRPDKARSASFGYSK